MDHLPERIPAAISLDATDARLLDLLQRDGRMVGAELGRRVGLSQPAVSARLRRLEKAGVITGYHASVDAALLGLGIHATIRLRTTHAHLNASLRLFEEIREIVRVLRLTGEDCFLIEVRCADAGRLEQIVDKVARFGPVTTSLVLRDHGLRPIDAQPVLPRC